MEATDNETLIDQLLEPVETPETQSEETEELEAEAAPLDETADDEPEGETDEIEDEGDDEEEIEDDDEEGPSEDLYTIMVDGQPRQVTLDELKRGYSGQSHIQKGMEENAQARKQLEASLSQANKYASAVVQMYQSAQQQGFMAPPQLPSQELAQKDPIAYTQAHAKYTAELQAYNQQQAEIQQLQQVQSQQAQQHQRQRVEQQMQTLIEKVPEFGDPVKGPKLRQKLMTVSADTYGLTEAELGRIDDARVLQVLHDAVRYRDLQSGKKRKVVDKAKGARPHVKPTKARASKPNDRAKLLQKATRSQSDEDFVNVLLSQ